MPSRWCGGKELLARESSANASYCWNVVTIRTDNNCPIKNIIERIFKKRQGEMNVRFLFLVALPSRATLFAVRGLLASYR
jgi:hypothetical protein